MVSVSVLIVFGVVLLLLLWLLFSYNGLVAARNRIRQCRSGICVALKQRNDMLPNLVAAAKAYMGHESDVLTRITALRTEAAAAREDAAQIKAGNELTSMLGRLQVAVEAYPELKADRQFVRLHDSVEQMENELQAIRRTYNAAVTLYNNKVEMFPSSLVASGFGFSREELIEIPAAECANVDMAALFQK